MSKIAESAVNPQAAALDEEEKEEEETPKPARKSSGRAAGIKSNVN